MDPNGRKAWLLAALGSALAMPAHAACPIELAVYSGSDAAASIEFRPRPQAAAVTNAFRLVLPDDLVLDGIVMWTDGIERPNGMLMHECPEGDVTGAEIDACTAWQGVIYSAGETGEIGLLPAEGEPAPRRLIFADLAYSVAHSSARKRLKPDALSGDVFELSGCQE